MFFYSYLSFRKHLAQVSYANVISPLAELEAQQFPLIQSCVFPKMVSTLDDVRKASCEAEKRLDSHLLMCRFQHFCSLRFFLSFFHCLFTYHVMYICNLVMEYGKMKQSS